MKKFLNLLAFVAAFHLITPIALGQQKNEVTIRCTQPNKSDFNLTFSKNDDELSVREDALKYILIKKIPAPRNGIIHSVSIFQLKTSSGEDRFFGISYFDPSKGDGTFKKDDIFWAYSVNSTNNITSNGACLSTGRKLEGIIER